MRRRDFIGLGLAAATQATANVPIVLAGEKSSIPYGVAVRGDALVDDFNYRAAIAKHCDLVVPEGGLKWETLRPTEASFNFYEGDKLLDFAQGHGMKMRGHTLVWYAAMPEWTSSIRGKSDAERQLSHHIDTVVGRYKGQVPSWDVVNEAIADDPTGTDYLRPNIWLENCGISYLETSFRRAADSDRAAQLVINEFDIEFVGDRYKRRREALLNVVRDLRGRDVPLHAVGFQGHLKGELEIDKEGVSTFVDELRRMDVDVLVTELDVIDHLLPADEATRDGMIASQVRDFLAAIHAVARPTALLTWGISDRYTWVPMYFTRDDGSPNRPLPLDRNYQPKALMNVIEEFTGK